MGTPGAEPLDYSSPVAANTNSTTNQNTLAMPCSIPLVMTVHDLSVLLHPQCNGTHRGVAEYAWQFEDSLKRACHVLAVSEFTKQEVVRHLGWPVDRITVTYNGRQPFLRPLSRPKNAHPFFRS